MQIVFNADGSADFTRNPVALDLMQGLGTKRIVRMTEVEFDEDIQRFWIRFKTGPYAGEPLHIGIPQFHAVAGKVWEGISYDLMVRATWPTLVVFETYELAVAFEVAFVDHLRDQGVNWRE